ILATFPLVAGIPQQDLIFHLVFFVYTITALIQCYAISPLAKWLGLVEGVSRPKAVSLDLVAVEECDTDLIEVEITPGAEVQGKLLSELDLPPTVAVSAIVRHKQVVTPRGNTRIEPGDVLFILAGKGSRERVLDVFTGEGHPTPASATYWAAQQAGRPRRQPEEQADHGPEDDRAPVGGRHPLRRAVGLGRIVPARLGGGRDLVHVAERPAHHRGEEALGRLPAVGPPAAPHPESMPRIGGRGQDRRQEVEGHPQGETEPLQPQPLE